MNVLDFEKLVRTESTARRFVLARCAMTAPFRCPSCGEERLYEIESGKRRRCPRCGHSFNPFSGRYLDRVKLSTSEWLWIVKLFELEASATVIASETGISYPTILKAIETIRHALADSAGSNGGGSGDCGADAAAGVFGAANAGGKEVTEPVARGSIVHHFRLNGDCLVMTERTPAYGHLLCCDRKIDVVDHGRGFPRLRVYCSAKGFWPYAKERFVKYHGVSLEKLPLYLEEMRFRWMNRGTPLFDLILQELCRYAQAGTLPKRARAAQYAN